MKQLNKLEKILIKMESLIQEIELAYQESYNEEIVPIPIERPLLTYRWIKDGDDIRWGRGSYQE